METSIFDAFDYFLKLPIYVTTSESRVKKSKLTPKKQQPALSKVWTTLKNNHSLENKIRFSVTLEAATGGALEKKVLKNDYSENIYQNINFFNCIFKDFNCKLECLLFKRGFIGLLLLHVYLLFTSLNLHYSGT